MLSKSWANKALCTKKPTHISVMRAHATGLVSHDAI